MVMQHSPPPKPIVSSLSSTTNNILAWGDLRRLNIIVFKVDRLQIILVAKKIYIYVSYDLQMILKLSSNS